MLPSTNLSDLLCIQSLDTAEKMGCLGLAEPNWQDASEPQEPDVLFKKTLSSEDYLCSDCLCCKCGYTAVVLNEQGKELGELIMEGFL